MPWYHLGSPVPHGYGLGEWCTLLRDDGRTRRGLPLLFIKEARRRGSETMFPPRFRAPFQLPGLSAAVLRRYSSLHCLLDVELLLGYNVRQIPRNVKYGM